MDLIFGKIWYKNGSIFQVSAARPYPNHTWVAPPGLYLHNVLVQTGHITAVIYYNAILETQTWYKFRRKRHHMLQKIVCQARETKKIQRYNTPFCVWQ